MKNKTELPIVVHGFELVTTTAAEDASIRRDELLAIARRGKTIDNAESASRAAELLKDIKGFTRSIEAARTEVKAPILEVGKKIDGLAKTLVSDLEAEATRISRILGVWQAEQNRIAAEIQQEAFRKELAIRQEAERKEQEAAAEAKRIADAAAAEAKAKEDALLAKANAAKSEAARQKALEAAEAVRLENIRNQEALEAERVRAEAERQDAATESLVANRVAVANTIPTKPAGIATRREVCFEVTDIAALYRAGSFFVTMTPNNAAIKAALKALQPGQTLPGVHHWEESKSIVRG